MFFYLYKNAPECVLDLDKVEELVVERFHLYSLPAVVQYDTEEFNYYDRISHLVMTIIAINCPTFRDTFMKGEVKLFKDKLQTRKGSSCLKKELCEVSEYLVSLSQSEEFKLLKSVFSKEFQLMLSIVEVISSKSSHSFRKAHLKSCRKYKLTLPFTSLLKLVAKRKVQVTGGKVSLSCGQWEELLEVIFEFLLKLEVKLIESNDNLRKLVCESEDDRMRQIVTRFTNLLNIGFSTSRPVVMADRIDEMSEFFPPCMAELHQILRRTHRLSYESRYQYTLFLRDIGMSVDENISFWENEYKKPHQHSSCTHNWEENQKRYKYQIQHLYGLINSHEPKTSHSCDKFINGFQGRMDGGCPFQHLTSEELKNALPESMTVLPDVEDIFTHKSNSMPQRCCAAYLSCLQKVVSKRESSREVADVNKWLHIVSPLQFYNIASSFC